MESKYVVFDGMDGSGKGTQMKFLQDLYGNRVEFTREPGGTPFAEEIRKVVRDNPLAGKSTAFNNALLFWAAREELQENLIGPTLLTGRPVFSDRGDSSTFAFQHYGEQQWSLIDFFWYMRERVFDPKIGRRSPDLYIIFDLSAEAARERVMNDPNREKNHFDMRDLEYYKRVRNGFLKFGESVPMVRIDATLPPEKVHQLVLIEIVKMLAE